jgi:hypothetical protein
MITVTGILNQRTMRQILQVKQSQIRNLSNSSMFNGSFSYNLAQQDNGTSTDNSRSNPNIAATVAIASILPMLIAIFLLVMIIMSVDNAFIKYP